MRSAGPSGLINTSHSDGSVSTCLQIKRRLWLETRGLSLLFTCLDGDRDVGVGRGCSSSGR